MNERSSLRFCALVLIIITVVISFICGAIIGPTALGEQLRSIQWTETPRISRALSASTPTAAAVPSPQLSPTTEVLPTATWVIPIPTPVPTLTPSLVPTSSPVPVAYRTLNVNEYPAFTVYWKRELWESEVRGTILTEDFENDPADYGLLRFPYLTGNGFLLTGQSSAQILRDRNLLKSGNFIHFRDSKDGLTFGFPDNKVVKAFGFDYRSPEKWQFAFDDSVVPLPGGRGGFVGIVVQKDYPQKFVLSSAERIQGGLSVDNISYFFDR